MIIIILWVLFNAPMFLAYQYLPRQFHSNGSGNLAFSIKSIKIYEAPHHVLIVYGRRYCSGSLTSSRIVVTAASCFRRRRGEQINVKAGISAMIEFGKINRVISIKIHEYYQHLCAVDNDIALLFLKEHYHLNHSRKKIVLVPPDTALRHNTPVNVLSWGSTNLKSQFINKIVQSQMYVMSTQECEKYYGDNIISDCNFCVKYRHNHISDNGGSVIYKDLLVGIVSAKATLQKPPRVAIITNVSFFHEWIMTNSVEFINKYCEEEKNYRRRYSHTL